MVSILNQKNAILEQVFTQLENAFSDDSKAILQQFITIIYQNVTVNDLMQMSQVDLVGSTVSLWRELQQWEPDKPKIQVFNPDVEQDEWQSSHTIISVLCRNTPFIIDTLKLILDEQGIKVHRMFYSEMEITRSNSGKLISFGAEDNDELLLYLEIDQTSIKAEREALASKIQAALVDISLVVNNYEPITNIVKEAIERVNKDKYFPDIGSVGIEKMFLPWLLEAHFTFIGCDQFVIEGDQVKAVPGSQLGLLTRDDFMGGSWQLESLVVLNAPYLLHFGKGSQRAMVHRSVYPDTVYIKRFNKAGKLVSGYRFVGFYTAAVYSGSPKEVPVVANKIENIFSLNLKKSLKIMVILKINMI